MIGNQRETIILTTTHIIYGGSFYDHRLSGFGRMSV